MDKQFRFLLAGVVGISAAFYLQACASVGDRIPPEMIQTYNLTYDQVWEALEELVNNDLRCVPKKISKKKGLIETEWVHRIDTYGTVRWMIVARVKKQKQGVQVFLDKKVQTADQVREQISRYKQKDTAPNPNSGWKTKDTDLKAVRKLYQQLEAKLD